MSRTIGKYAHARYAPPAIYELGAYSIFGFCLAHGLSRRKFYYMLEAGDGPRLMRCGRRTLISVEAARDWRRACERTPAASRSTAAKADRRATKTRRRLVAAGKGSRKRGGGKRVLRGSRGRSRVSRS